MDNSRSRADMLKEISSLEKKFVKVSNQISMLEKRLGDAVQRRDAAHMQSQSNFAYIHTLRMGVTEGVINVLYEYIRNLAADIKELRWRLYFEALAVIDDGESDTEDGVTSEEEMEDVYMEIP